MPGSGSSRVSFTNPFTTKQAANAAAFGESLILALLVADTVALRCEGLYREADELLGQPSIRGASPNARNLRSSVPSANAT
jgi:hypothetical protein